MVELFVVEVVEHAAGLDEHVVVEMRAVEGEVEGRLDRRRVGEVAPRQQIEEGVGVADALGARERRSRRLGEDLR